MREVISKHNFCFTTFTSYKCIVYMNKTKMIHEFIYQNGYTLNEDNFIGAFVNRKYNMINEYYSAFTEDIKSWRKYTQECVK